MVIPSTGAFAAKVVAKSTLEKERARAKILTEIRIHRGCDNAHVVRSGLSVLRVCASVYIPASWSSAATATLADVVKARGRLTEPECAAYAREIVLKSRTSTRTGSYTGTSSSVTCSSPRGRLSEAWKPPGAAAQSSINRRRN